MTVIHTRITSRSQRVNKGNRDSKFEQLSGLNLNGVAVNLNGITDFRRVSKRCHVDLGVALLSGSPCNYRHPPFGLFRRSLRSGSAALRDRRQPRIRCAGGTETPRCVSACRGPCSETPRCLRPPGVYSESHRFTLWISVIVSTAVVGDEC